MGVAGRKQIHISSHKMGSWVNQVAGLIDRTTGESAYHVIDQKFKCQGHSHVRAHFCACQAIYCPSHVMVSDSLTQLINLISPSGELELTGHIDTPSDDNMMIPFGKDIVNLFLGTVINIVGKDVTRFYICMDPTYSSGTHSSLGVASFAELGDGTTVLLAIDEVLVTGIQMAYFNMYSAITMAHIKLIKDYMGGGNQQVVYVPEANTYQQPNYNLWCQVRAMAYKEYGIKLMLYMQYRAATHHWGVGRLVGVNKPQLVILLHETILQRGYAVNSVVFSFGSLIRGIFVNQKNLLRLKYKLEIFRKTTTDGTTPVQANLPTSCEDLFAMPPAECVEFLFNNLAGRYFRCEKFDEILMLDGLECLEKLKSQLTQITIKKTDRGTMKVLTGGKKSMGQNKYTRDDLFSAILLSSGLFSKLSQWKVVHTPETEFQ